MRRLIAFLMLMPLAACDDDKPKVTIDAVAFCEETTDVMVKMAQACAQGGGKYPEDCVKTAVANFCPNLTAYRVSGPAYQTSEWRRCTEARSPEAKAACAAFTK